MQVEYDKQARATYIRIKRGRVARTIKLQDTLLVDINKKNEVLGIELLGSIKAPQKQRGAFRIPVSVR